ncbi:MAG: serine--tRNA ligase [Candidatus Woesearchaeota archaeon]
MIDIKLVRENPEVIKKDLEKRGALEKISIVEKLKENDNMYRKLLSDVQKLRHERNSIAENINRLKKEGKDASKLLLDAKDIPKRIKENEEQTEKLQQEIRLMQMSLPNLLHGSVPVGKDDSENEEVRVVGKPPKFNFTPKSHVEICQNLGLIDFDRAAKVSGSGFFYLKGPLVLLDMALQRFAVDFLVKKGYTAIWPPLMIRREPYEGVTDLSDFESVMYKIDSDDLYLIATSEHAMAAMYQNEVFEKKSLPLKLCGVSPCFRREIGSHGKYTKGLFRVHNFNKVEQFLFCLPEDSWNLHEELQRNSEELYQQLGLHYRVVNICTGDIGSIAAKKYDIEVWMADCNFREVGSNSNCTDYQARRLNIKYREKEGTPPIGFLHTLNNTAIATSRTMIAILEQYQKSDGSVTVPKVLQPYMAGLQRIQ